MIFQINAPEDCVVVVQNSEAPVTDESQGYPIKYRIMTDYEMSLRSDRRKSQKTCNLNIFQHSIRKKPGELEELSLGDVSQPRQPGVKEDKG